MITIQLNFRCVPQFSAHVQRKEHEVSRPHPLADKKNIPHLLSPSTSVGYVLGLLCTPKQAYDTLFSSAKRTPWIVPPRWVPVGRTVRLNSVRFGVAAQTSWVRHGVYPTHKGSRYVRFIRYVHLLHFLSLLQQKLCRLHCRFLSALKS